MKKYMSLFSLIAIFFTGIIQMEAQELEKRSLDNGEEKQKKEQYYKLQQKKKEQESSVHLEKKAKLSKIKASDKAKKQIKEIDDAITLSADQQHAMHKVLLDLNLKVDALGSDKNKKTQEVEAELNGEAHSKILEILDKKQVKSYNAFLEKKRMNK